MIHLATFLGMDMSQHIVFQILDGLVVILFLFLLYRMIRGTAAFQICIGLVVVYFMWWLSSLLGMPLLSNILNQVINVGVIAVLVIFQPEIRRFLLLLGNKDVVGSKMKKIYEQIRHHAPSDRLTISPIVQACQSLAASKTGALIIIKNAQTLDDVIQTGEYIDARLSAELLKNIFFKNSPLHDGAVVVQNNRIAAARCILPVSRNEHLPNDLGLRHRSALGITEISDAVAVIVSEQTGHISYSRFGEIQQDITSVQLINELVKVFNEKTANAKNQQ